MPLQLNPERFKMSCNSSNGGSFRNYRNNNINSKNIAIYITELKILHQLLILQL